MIITDLRDDDGGGLVSFDLLWWNCGVEAGSSEVSLV